MPEYITTILKITYLDNSVLTWISALLTLLFFLLLRKLLGKFLISMLRTTVQKTRTDLDDKLLTTIEKPLQFALVLAGVYSAQLILLLSPEVQAHFDKLFRAFSVIVVIWTIYRAVDIFTEPLRNATQKIHNNVTDELANFVIKSIKFIVIAMAFVTVMQEFGYNISGFVASLGLGGLAFALAAKDSAANLFGSLVIFSDQPFNTGDWIQTPDVEGVIEDIGVRSTKVRTFSQALVTVPNAVLANSPITNWSRMGKRRIKMKLGLEYSTTALQMKNITDQIRDYLNNHDGIDKKTIFVHFNDFNESSLGVFCYFFTKTTNWGEFLALQEEINLKFMSIVEENGSSFAFPTRTLHISESIQNG